MMRWCVYCEPAHFLGEVEPLEQKDRTDGLCPAAAAREERKLDELLAERHLTDFKISAASLNGDSSRSWRKGPSPCPSAAPAASRGGDASPDKTAAEGRDPHRPRAAASDFTEGCALREGKALKRAAPVAPPSGREAVRLTGECKAATRTADLSMTARRDDARREAERCPRASQNATDSRGGMGLARPLVARARTAAIVYGQPGQDRPMLTVRFVTYVKRTPARTRAGLGMPSERRVIRRKVCACEYVAGRPPVGSSANARPISLNKTQGDY